MKTYLGVHHHPRVKLALRLGKKELKVDGMIDTGFSSGVALSERWLFAHDLRPVARQDFEIADGSIVSYDLYLAELKNDALKKKLPLIFTRSDDNLVGMEFLNGLRLLLDLKEYQVTLE